MQRKYIIALIFILIIILSVILLYFLLNNSNSLGENKELKNDEINSGKEQKYLLGTVIKKNSSDDITIRLDNKNIIDDSEISLSNIQPGFELGDRIKINYIIESNNLQITNIEKYIDEGNEKYKNIKNVMEDEILQSYNEQIEVTTDNQKIEHFILPYKLSGIEYIPIEEEDFFSVYNHVYDGMHTETQIDNLINVNINSHEEFEIKKLYNLNNKTQKNIEYIQKGSNLQFKSIGTGIYCLELDYKNGDCIEVIFK